MILGKLASTIYHEGSRMRRHLPLLAILALFFFLPLVMFSAQTVGGRTLLPSENIYQYEPYLTYREEAGAPAVPHNHLLSDLVLQNYPFKLFIREQLAAGEFPLWNPHQFSGIAFFAAGQQSTLYPFSILFYLLDLPAAYGWFIVSQLWLAGMFMFAFARGLGISRFGATLSGVIYQLAAFFVISAVFPMIVAAAVWLPLILLMCEYILRRQPAFGGDGTPLWVAVGALALGCAVLAGHVEITYYTLLIAGFYAAWRLVGAVSRAGWLLAMVVLGMLLGMVQFLPTFEAANGSFRTGRASFEQVLGYAHPPRDALLFVMPNFYGNPSHHAIHDWFTGTTIPVTVNALGQPITHTEWGEKNYVEGALYLGILPLLLAGYAVVSGFWRDNGRTDAMNGVPTNRSSRSHILLFAALALLALTFMFGLPTYALLYYGLPGVNQLHSPFRWVFALTLCVAVLAGFGVDRWMARGRVRQGQTDAARLVPTDAGVSELPTSDDAERSLPVGRVVPTDASGVVGTTHASSALRNLIGIINLSTLVFSFGALILIALVASRVFYAQAEPLAARALDGLARANGAFADAYQFYNYQFTNVLIFGVMTLGAGAALWGLRRWNSAAVQGRNTLRPYEGSTGLEAPLPARSTFGRGVEVRAYAVQIAVVALVAIDLMIASWGFNPASDPALLRYTPPAVEWLRAREGDWRFTTLETPGRPAIMNANLGMVYGFDDVRGYESLIPRTYVQYMQQIAPQNQLAFNRVAPLWTTEQYVASLEAPQIDALNVRYLMTYADQAVSAAGWSLAYEDAAVRIYENAEALGVVFAAADGMNAVPTESPVVGTPLMASVMSSSNDLRITHVSAREMLIDLTTDQPETLLVLSMSYDPGWRAFSRPMGAGEEAETQIEIAPVDADRLTADGMNAVPTESAVVETPLMASAAGSGALLTLTIPEAGARTIHLVYSPTSVQVGAFASFIGGALLLLVVGGWAWRRTVRRDGEQGAAGRVARNSLVPILLNLFNRGIDFAFAAIMLRLLGPELSGWYYYAIVLFGWFDILTNFGLNLFVTREVARDRSQARRLLVNTSALRLALAGVGVPLLAAFLWLRLSDTASPVPTEALIAIVLLYVGLLPNSLSTGLTALYYAFERAEIPAAVTTIATICKAIFGVAVLLAGWSIVGLAAASIVTNVITLAVLVWNGRGLLRATRETEEAQARAAENARTRHASSLQHDDDPRRDDARVVRSGGFSLSLLDLPLIRGMIGQSAPLMLNHFLATIFFKIDIILIEAIHTATMVGQYSVAYKWVEALNVIPSFFTQALLPMLSRQAHDDRAAFVRNYRLGIKLLFMLALPIAVVFTVIAEALTNLLGGAQFLPDGAIALQLMIWSIPIGWMNSLTQYALIALDMQRRITVAFVAGVSFNIITNLIFIPEYGYRAAALTTIASEGVLFIAFAWLLYREIGQRDWLSLVWRPVVAGAAMLAVLWLGVSSAPLLALVIAGAAYAGVLWGLRPFTEDEQVRLMPILPGPLRRMFIRAT